MSLIARIQNEDEPQTFGEACKHPSWIDAMKAHIDTLMKNET